MRHVKRVAALVLSSGFLFLSSPAFAADGTVAIGLEMDQPNGYTFTGFFALDAAGNLFSSPYSPFNIPAWSYRGGNQLQRSRGLVSTSAAPNHLGVWGISQVGHVVLNYDYYGSWYWWDAGTPPCGTVASSLSAASSGTVSAGYIGVVVRCTNGSLAEYWWNGASWGWAAHGSPPGISLVGDPSMASSASYLGAVSLASDGNIWELTALGGTVGGWVSLGRPLSAPTFVGSPTLVTGVNFGPAAVYISDTNGNLFELADYVFGFWEWGGPFIYWCAIDPSPGVVVQTNTGHPIANVLCTQGSLGILDIDNSTWTSEYLLPWPQQSPATKMSGTYLPGATGPTVAYEDAYGEVMIYWQPPNAAFAANYGSLP